MKINVTTASTKTYSIADLKGEFYVTSFSDDGSEHRRVWISGFDKTNMASTKMQCFDVAVAARIQKLLSEAAPLNVDITYDSNFVTDQEKKADILSRLVVIEQVVQTTTSIRSLTAASIKKAKDEEAVKRQVSGLMQKVSKKVATLPVDKCKKIKELLSELN